MMRQRYRPTKKQATQSAVSKPRFPLSALRGKKVDEISELPSF